MEVFENGSSVALLQDTFGLSVNWLKIGFSNGNVQYSLNGFVRYQHSIPVQGESYSIHVGAIGEEAEINNIYSASTALANCCSFALEVNNLPIPTGIYRAENILSSSGTVPATATVFFQAGTEVRLEEGFEILPGAVFETSNSGCDLSSPNSLNCLSAHP